MRTALAAWWRTLTYRRPDRDPRQPKRDLRELLHKNEDAEEFLADMLKVCDTPDHASALASRILDVRDERVRILRQLRWHASANELAEDTAMRRRLVVSDGWAGE